MPNPTPHPDYWRAWRFAPERQADGSIGGIMTAQGVFHSWVRGWRRTPEGLIVCETQEFPDPEWEQYVGRLEQSRMVG